MPRYIAAATAATAGLQGIGGEASDGILVLY